MKILAFVALACVLVIVSLGLFTYLKARSIEAAFPNTGELTDVGGYRMNAVHIPAGPQADLPPLVFIHGASGNLHDPEQAFRAPLEGRAEMLFLDRPGHGYSDRGGPENDMPDGQAEAVSKLMDHYGIRQAIVIAHSFGGSIAASLALQHPDKVKGLVFLSAATHPWPGGVDWYYRVASMPVVGWLFTHLITLPAGLDRIESGSAYVFDPNRAPPDYARKAAIPLLLRPNEFRSNAIDVANLHDYVSRIAVHYPEIKAPTVIITGDADRVVLEQIHSRGLARDIRGSELIRVHGLGHKPDYIATDLAIAAMEKLAGMNRDLPAIARTVEARIAAEAGG